MQNGLIELKKMWTKEGIGKSPSISDYEISLFESKNKLFLPKDLIEYFKILNGTQDTYDENFFKFYSLDQFKNVYEVYGDWEGIPNYRNIIYTLPDYKNAFVFADYNCNLFSYLIRLYPYNVDRNEVLVISGEKYNSIGYSFSEFIDLYLRESDKLFF